MSFEETLAALLQQIAALRAELERVTAELYAVHPWPADAELAVSPARAGELTGYTAETILAHVNAGHLRATKPAGSREWRILVDDLRRWISAETSEKPVLDNRAEAAMIVATLAGKRGRR